MAFPSVASVTKGARSGNATSTSIAQPAGATTGQLAIVLLAKAMGASVRPAVTPELGWIDVTTNDAGARRAWFGDRDTFTTFEWHDETFALPPGAKRVLTNSYNVEQGFLLDDRHLGLQCHLEMTAELLKSWLASSAGELPAVSLPERQSAAEVRRDLPQRLARLHAVAGDVYARWTQGLAP